MGYKCMELYNTIQILYAHMRSELKRPVVGVLTYNIYNILASE